LKLTMLKSGTYPNPDADQGIHHFTYSLLPHQGGFREAGIIRESYSLNQPMLVLESNGSGKLPGSFSLVSCDQKAVVMETVKKAEADDSMILRMYESFGSRCQATFTVAPGFQKAVLCDLMENPLEEIPFDGKTFTLPVSNFEIITVKLIRA
jgi:alpha-mannosidase